MSRWGREELEEAFDRYQAAALKGAQQADWRDWAHGKTGAYDYALQTHNRSWPAIVG